MRQNNYELAMEMALDSIRDGASRNVAVATATAKFRLSVDERYLLDGELDAREESRRIKDIMLLAL